ncbi:phosphohistidine phosphatase SixA [Actinobacillus seminis]|uniref:phosphohistidine phosphatase SixA n=1 Tax=Actinobacillus seminis TaxID=722 RepID=UPI003B950565
MKIWIMRHGEAEVMAKSDKDRHLNARGRAQAGAQGIWLKKTELGTFDKILVSPYVRTRETAGLIDQVYKGEFAQKYEFWDEITPYGNATNVASYLSLLADQGVQQVLLVSHLPLVGEIVSEICGVNPVSFYPATLVALNWEKGSSRGNVVEIKYPD